MIAAKKQRPPKQRRYPLSRIKQEGLKREIFYSKQRFLGRPSSWLGKNDATLLATRERHFDIPFNLIRTKNQRFLIKTFSSLTNKMVA
jgi:hypothetical protein